jgi:hypothetical protein
MNEQQKEAINLMIEDLYTSHNDIRQQAKILNCEQELNKLRDDVVNYLKSYQ